MQTVNEDIFQALMPHILSKGLALHITGRVGEKTWG